MDPPKDRSVIMSSKTFSNGLENKGLEGIPILKEGKAIGTLGLKKTTSPVGKEIVVAEYNWKEQ